MDVGRSAWTILCCLPLAAWTVLTVADPAEAARVLHGRKKSRFDDVHSRKTADD